LHYVDEGDGPPLVLYHGNPTLSFLYRNIITALRGRFRCIAAETPRTRSALAVATAMLIGPPQSCAISRYVADPAGRSESPKPR
jgi:pimeloyl-ACP methyl ester carboxylesterase